MMVHSWTALFVYHSAVVEPGQPAWKFVVSHFGEGILLENRHINRGKLASEIFSNQEQRRALNRCTHPYIRRAVIWEIIKCFIKGNGN